MISNHLRNVFSLAKQKREILWFGAQDDVPPKQLGDLIKRIQFVPLEKIPTVDSNKFSAAVISVHRLNEPTPAVIDALVRIDLPKYLVVPAGMTLRSGDFDLINRVHFAGIFSLPGQENELALMLKDQLDQTYQHANAEGSLKNLESEYRGLESLDQAGTQHVASTKREIELKVLRIRKLIRFLEQLALLHSIEEFLRLLRNEFKEFHHVKDPVLVIGGANKPSNVYYFQGNQVLKKITKHSWPTIAHARFNDTRDSQYLADLFSRPFARLFSVPISIRSRQQEGDVSSGALYFEHAMAEQARDEFVTYFEERLHLIGVALDRLFLESDLRDASLLWERTFDEIADPVAIFDDDKNLVRSNKAFQKYLAGLLPGDTSGDSIQHKGRTFEIRRYPIAGGSGSFSTNVVIHYFDVTLGHQLQKQIIQQEKMAALGHLAGNIAHELNNPLTGIKSMAQILIEKSKLSEQVRSDLSEVEAAAERCQKIIKNLLDFSRGAGEQELSPIEMNEIVRRTMPLLKTMIGMHELTLNFTESANLVIVEPQLFQQVVFNLIKNACQAMSEPGGQLKIETDVKTIEGRTYVTLKVSDSGVGMSDEVRSQIFEYFFTTKPKGEGTGLGLSMSRSIVERFGGRIQVASQAGSGTTFEVEVPLHIPGEKN